ncbi:methyltransferase family protein [Panacagrimonas perspica]|uniref:Methyltransferase family protein n=1 Tax=Panacagrimonas perspica TaxID=381431 RepID=A0A4R7NYU6_9GAMM|nr:class I SAM-dependent methyltransferase [Panacagrimonas perspica]TDU26503.1 methyltransferase family protein [Panacagrimonas perspica]THD02170.1 SAM-dependent methyltransferase [Panacagrimonas perspica]
MTNDPFSQFKAGQREAWALFSPMATFTTPPAATLVEFAAVRESDKVLDVACGTGVVAVTAALRGANTRGLDLSPVLLEDAAANAATVGLSIEFLEGDAEALPYDDGTFDVVLSQFGHMFAPRPELATAEMLRVLRPGGTIAFSTWPPDLMIGSIFSLLGRYLPGPTNAAPPSQWGDPNIVRQRLGDAVKDVQFQYDDMVMPALSPKHYLAHMERTAGPVIKLVQTLKDEPGRLTQFRAEMELLIARFFSHNRVRQTFLMTRATKC